MRDDIDKDKDVYKDSLTPGETVVSSIGGVVRVVVWFAIAQFIIVIAVCLLFLSRSDELTTNQTTGTYQSYDVYDDLEFTGELSPVERELSGLD